MGNVDALSKLPVDKGPAEMVETASQVPRPIRKPNC